MQNFKAQYNLNRWVLKKFTPLTVVTKGKISYIDQNNFLHQAVNKFFSAVKLGILTWGVYGIDSLLQPASSGQFMNCSFSHFRVGFTRESGRLPLGFRLTTRVRCLCTLVIQLSFSSDFWDQLWVGLGLGVGIGLDLCFWTVILFQDQQKMLIQEHVWLGKITAT